MGPWFVGMFTGYILYFNRDSKIKLDTVSKLKSLIPYQKAFPFSDHQLTLVDFGLEYNFRCDIGLLSFHANEL